jgi:hypothetical protein
MKIEPGIYKLTRNIPNPKPDRRSKEWSKQPELTPGTFIVRSMGGDLSDLRTISKMGEKDWDKINEPSHRGSEYSDLRFEQMWDTLIANLEPAPERLTVYTFFRLHDINPYNGDDVLAELIRSQKITYNDIKAAYEAFLTRTDD